MFPKNLCISIAEFPGKTGGAMHNTGYKELGLEFVYVPLKVTPKNLKNAINGVRGLGIRGCGVSMPHKVRVIEFLDRLDEKAGKIGAVNTIVNENGKLAGYNTDYYAILAALNGIDSKGGREAVVIGAGGAARAAILALKDSGWANVSVLNRTDKKAKDLADEFDVHFIKWKDLGKIKGMVLVNATPIGMKQVKSSLVAGKKILTHFSAVIDLVTDQLETSLIKEGKELGLIAVPGYRIALLQAAKQFELYTGHHAPLEVMERKLMELLSD